MTWTELIKVFTTNSGVKSSKYNNLRVAYYVQIFMMDEWLVDERYAHMLQFSLQWIGMHVGDTRCMLSGRISSSYERISMV